MHCASKDKWFKTRIGTIVGAYVLDCLSGQRDIGGSVVTRSARIVLSVGASDCWQEIYFRIAVSDDGGKSFAVKFERPAIEDVTYHTTGMTYDEKNDVLMAKPTITSPLRPSMNKDDQSTTKSQRNIGSFLTLSGSAFYSGSKPENGLGNTVCILRE